MNFENSEDCGYSGVVGVAVTAVASREVTSSVTRLPHDGRGLGNAGPGERRLQGTAVGSHEIPLVA